MSNSVALLPSVTNNTAVNSTIGYDVLFYK